MKICRARPAQSSHSTLYVGGRLDWFFAHQKGKNSDQVKNLASGEVVTSI